MILGYAKIHDGDSEWLNFQKQNETHLAQLHLDTRKGAQRRKAPTPGGTVKWNPGEPVAWERPGGVGKALCICVFSGGRHGL